MLCQTSKLQKPHSIPLTTSCSGSYTRPLLGPSQARPASSPACDGIRPQAQHNTKARTLGSLHHEHARMPPGCVIKGLGLGWGTYTHSSNKRTQTRPPASLLFTGAVQSTITAGKMPKVHCTT